MIVLRKLAVKRTVIGLAAAGLVSGLLLVGCGGGSSSSTAGGGTPAGVTPLAVQTGQQSYVFYGKSDHTTLLSIRDVSVIDPKQSSTVLLQNLGSNVANGTFVSTTSPTAPATGAQPKPSTAMIGYDPITQSYTDLYVDSLYYAYNGNPFKVSMKKEAGIVTPTAQGHSSATGLTAPKHQEVEYLGTKVFLNAKDSAGLDILICPLADGTSTPMPFNKKVLFTIAYDSYGAAPTGIIAHNTLTGQLEHGAPSTASCAACGIMGVDAVFTPITTGSPAVTPGNPTAVPPVPATAYKFLGDIGGTSKSMLLIDGALYILDKNKAVLSLTAVALNPASTVVTALNFKGFNGDSAYFLSVDAATKVGTITRVKSDGTVIQVASNTKIGKLHGFTNEWVIYGMNDDSMHAAKKDGTTATPHELSVTTKTTGHRISNSNMAFGNKHLYTTYKLDTATGKMTYQACMFDGDGTTMVHEMPAMIDVVYPGSITCRQNGFWAALTAAKQGKLNFNASFPYSPYALLRVDVTDENGGGTLVAVDPAAPLGDGVTMGSVPNYSFDTFMQQYNYRTKMIDSDGYVVVYGKDDLNVKGDAFLVNLNKANSLVNLTNEAPAGAEISASTNTLHCHGRTCATCHSYAGGKIFSNKTGLVEHLAYDHNIRFKFKDGTSKMARRGKGKGENFNLPLKDIVDSFTAEVVQVDASGNVVAVSNSSLPFSHGGKEFFNCDLCHNKSPSDSITSLYLPAQLPGAISIAP